jgi:hypothetical protein
VKNNQIILTTRGLMIFQEERLNEIWFKYYLYSFQAGKFFQNTLGTLINRQFVTGGTGKKSSGGGSSSLEYVLAPLTNYLFRLTNVNSTAHTALLELEWYE